MARRSNKSPRADHDLGIHTARPTSLDAFVIPSGNRVHANRYEPTPFGILEDMLLELGLELSAEPRAAGRAQAHDPSVRGPLDVSRFSFLDLGSGKGRVLCLAAHLPFHHVVGVEFAPELHAIAEENLAALPGTWRRARRVSAVLGDAATFDLPREPLILFMFNPFTAPVLARVLANLERSLGERPREAFVLYYMPVHGDLLDASPFLEVHARSKTWTIYRAVS